MGRAKLPRKSTAIDMTPFCDVAFLLLTFFILTTKFKPDEKIPINTPSSVATELAPEKNFIKISLNKDGKAFINSDREDVKTKALDFLNNDLKLGLTDGEIHRLANLPVIGTSFQNLKEYSTYQPAQLNASLPGIPVQDTANNQLKEWMKAFVDVQRDLMSQDPEDKNNQLKVVLKGDNMTKFPQFRNVITALTDNMILEFKMVTNPEAVPKGSELWKQAQDAPETATKG